MNKNLKNIFKSVTLLGLITILITPSVLNFVHSFQHHEHQVNCDEQDKNKAHLHELEFECSYIQLWSSPQSFNTLVFLSPKRILHNYINCITKYSFEYFSSTFIKDTPHRGPPRIK